MPAFLTKKCQMRQSGPGCAKEERLDTVVEESRLDDIDGEIDALISQLSDVYPLLESEDTGEIMRGLSWFEHFYEISDVCIPNEAILQILNFLGCPDPAVVALAFRVLSLCVSFRSAMVNALVENGLLDHLDRIFPELESIFMAQSLLENSPEIRDEMVRCGFVEKIAALFTLEPPPISDIALLCRALLYHRIDFELNGPAIFDIFANLMRFTSGCDVDTMIDIADAAFYLIRSNPNFIIGFMETRMDSVFLESRIDHPRFVHLTLRITRYLCNAEPDEIRDQLVRSGVFDYVDEHIHEEDAKLSTTAVDVVSDLLLRSPHYIEVVFQKGILEKVIDMFASSPCGGFKEAAVQLIVVVMALASEQLYDNIYLIGAIGVLINGTDLIAPEALGWALNVFGRLFHHSNPAHERQVIETLTKCPEFVCWLEEMRASENDEYAMKAAAILNFMYPDTK